MSDIRASHGDGSGAYKRLVDMGDDTHAERVTTVNVTTKFREAFESFTPDEKWRLTVGAGDIVALDGNAAASSYLVISKDPLTADSETSLDTVQTFGMPFDAAFGLSMSQRTLGQEVFVEAVSDDSPVAVPGDIAIASISQSTTTLSVTTGVAHGLRPGMRIGIRGVSDARLNYSAVVVATTPSVTTFTVTAGPGGNLPSLTVGPFTSGFVYYRSAMRGAPNGSVMVFENGSATNASFYLRSESGDVLPSGTFTGNHAVSVATSASVQAINAALTYAFQPTTEYRLQQMVDAVQWSDIPVDSVAGYTNRTRRTQVCPDPTHNYEIRFRAVNNKALTVPAAQIVSAAKTGTTTATVITATAHGLVTGDLVQIYGARDQTNFANVATPTAVTVVDATTFQIVWGGAVTATTYGGLVTRPNGGQTLQGLVANGNVQSVTRSGNILSVVTLSAVTGLLIGDYVNLYGARDATVGATVGVDGAYRVRDIQTTTVFLEPIVGYTSASPTVAVTASPTGIDIGSTNCGGVLLRRTDLRVSYVRVLDFERHRVEIMSRPNGDISGSVPVTVQNTPAVTVSSGTVTTVSTVTSVTALAGGQAAHDAVIAGAPLRTAGRAVTANYTAVATGDVADFISTTVGAQITKPYAIPEQEWSYTGALTTTADVAAQAAAGAGLKRHATLLQATNTGASAVDVLLRDGTTTRQQITIPASQSVVMPLPTGIPVTANTALNVALSAAGTVRVNLLGYTAP